MIDLKRNIPFEESIKNCGTTFLRPDSTPLLCYRAAKKFVDEYEREEREQRHEKQKHELSSEDFECLLKLAETVMRKLLPDHVCDEEKHESPKPEREEHEQRHEAQKREEPKVGEVYRDILGNKYIVTAVHDSFPDDARGNKPFIVLKHVESNGRIALSDYFSPYLEDFMNPTFKKYN